MKRTVRFGGSGLENEMCHLTINRGWLVAPASREESRIYGWYRKVKSSCIEVVTEVTQTAPGLCILS